MRTPCGRSTEKSFSSTLRTDEKIKSFINIVCIMVSYFIYFNKILNYPTNSLRSSPENSFSSERSVDEKMNKVLTCISAIQ
jgi:hypothetical protein